MIKLILTNCDTCDEWFCIIHNKHYSICGCPGLHEPNIDLEVIE